MAGIIDRHDEGLHIRLRSTRRTPYISGARLRLGRGSAHRSGRPKAVGVHLPRATSASAVGVGIVKAKFVSAARAGGLSHYLQKDVPEKVSNYIGREGAGHEGHKAELFGARGPISEDERQGFVSRAQRDPRIWHLIVSPPSADTLDMPLVVNRFMEQFEADTSIKPDWIASIHRDTDHVHSHILLRGRASGGAEFRLERDYLSHGMRQRVEQIAQRHLDLGLSREAMRETVVEVAHSRTVPQQEAQQRLQEALATWREGHARAFQGRQPEQGHGIGY